MAIVGKADGNPTKGFFVRMITRDITLEDCVLDLVDNSIDGAWKLAGGKPAGLASTVNLQSYHIDIFANAHGFSIHDNCGGFDLKTAEGYAFTFGRKDTDSHDDYSIGVYGIGMKRAIFKMGRKIDVRSTYLPTTTKKLSAFRVDVDVTEWLGRQDENDWDFNIHDEPPAPAAGVRIDVTELTPDTRALFGDEGFLNRLRRIIARDYTLHLHHGIVIKLNGKPIRGWNIEFQAGKDIQPARQQYADGTGDSRVAVELVGGMMAPPPDDAGQPEDLDEDDAFGWYVICNGRVVLAADKSSNAGWGTEDWPQWHGQYNGFLGIIVFTAEDASLLPLTTTKRNVDLSSEVFRRARPRMREISKSWIAYTNNRKRAIDDAKVLETSSAPVSVFSVPARQQLVLPTLSIKPKEKVANISYAVPLQRFNRLALALGNVNMAKRELGLRTFEMAFKREIGS